jgi:ubiquinone/menaquinone biosynthesis C-methylase UbiE
MTDARAPEEIVAAERALRDREAPSYDDARSEWEHAVHEEAAARLLALRPGETIIDAGSGPGVMVARYLGAGAQVIAVDHSEKSLELVWERVPPGERDRLRTVQADLRSLPLEDACADASSCLGVLQHIPTHEFRLAAARELLRCLKPGGRLVVITYRWLGHVKRNKEGWWTPELYRYAFTIGELEALLREAGFVHVKSGGLLLFPRLSERLGTPPGLHYRLAFTPLGRLLGDYVISRAERPL